MYLQVTGYLICQFEQFTLIYLHVAITVQFTWLLSYHCSIYIYLTVQFSVVPIFQTINDIPICYSLRQQFSVYITCDGLRSAPSSENTGTNKAHSSSDGIIQRSFCLNVMSTEINIIFMCKKFTCLSQSDSKLESSSF